MCLCVQWREVDYEWLGRNSDEVATSIFKDGKNSPNAIKHKLSDVSTAASLFAAAGAFEVIGAALLAVKQTTAGVPYQTSLTRRKVAPAV
jgi:hypothetical protein